MFRNMMKSSCWNHAAVRIRVLFFFRSTLQSCDMNAECCVTISYWCQRRGVEFKRASASCSLSLSALFFKMPALSQALWVLLAAPLPFITTFARSIPFCPFWIAHNAAVMNNNNAQITCGVISKLTSFMWHRCGLIAIFFVIELPRKRSETTNSIDNFIHIFNMILNECVNLFLIPFMLCIPNINLICNKGQTCQTNITFLIMNITFFPDPKLFVTNARHVMPNVSHQSCLIANIR